ncbi:tRNA (carboxymethyluridine(34)-5-O)-methyltransferase isoform X1 [Dendrobium catenatum]|uniref:tRNA (carboxymethyluridine(34)-5-O)-methyltransferase isoform X1 n=2 Tax=Dendrobium catenatum TaxID=906689 RepID=UPI0010A07462|nr:tRNA (carboxymethyluridine(34)-5-O)-methyltransferase isoform X1 [Dendrobium catenatum]XP_028552768.1 tRNA (carboxymethyluridine(34)-5-O)-methyltransferase isoform X1 [Dendrobium catenatum]
MNVLLLPFVTKSVRFISQLLERNASQNLVPGITSNFPKIILTQESSIKYACSFSLVSDSSTRSTGKSVKFCSMVASTTMTDASKYQESDSAKIDTPCSANVCATPDIEKKYVHHVYNAIAPHFSATRFARWPKVASFLNSLSPGAVILDAGCGNGKYLGFNPNCFYIGCDISPSLIDICAKKDHEVLVADAVNLPYKTNFGDAAISIAVLHHLSTESRRRKAIEELIRVVRKGGTVLITVWAVEQEDSSLLSKWTPLSEKYNEGWVSGSIPQVRNSAALMLKQIPEANEDCCSTTGISKHRYAHPGYVEEGRREDNVFAASFCNGIQEDAISSSKAVTNQEYFVPWHLPYHRAEVNGTSTTAIANGLAKKDDKKGAVVYNRYYHVFAEGELQRLVTGIENAATVEQFYDKSNWCIILQKR